MLQNGSEQMVSSEQKKSSEEFEESEIVNNNNNNFEYQNQNNEENNINNEPNESEQIPTENNNGKKEGQVQINNYDYEQNKKEIMEKIEIRKQQADSVDKYIHETGIGISFQIIFSELISKKIAVENYYKYTASSLREIGREKEALDRKNNKKK